MLENQGVKMKFQEYKAMQESKQQAEYERTMEEIGIEIITLKEAN